MNLFNRLAAIQGQWLTRHSTFFIVAIIVITLLLLVPLALLAPTEQASQSPGGPIFDLQKEVNRRFPPRVHITSFIMEDRQGDVLRQAPLWELYQNEQRLRQSQLANYLYNGYDADHNRQIIGIYTVADAIQSLFRLDPRFGGVTLETATDDQVKLAVARVMASPQGEPVRVSLSKDANAQRREVNGQEIDYWTAKAMTLIVASDNQALGGGPAIFGLEPDETTLRKERYNRQVQELLRGEQVNYRMWGIGIDLNLESIDQGKTAVPYIVATIALVIVVVGVFLRSWLLMGLSLAGLVMMLVWLKGFSNLIGLKSSLTLDLIVPIAMISLGVDYTIHAMSRYREERRSALEPRRALQAAFAGVLGALTLAMLSDGVAFLSNLTSGIETIIGFGVAAGAAVFGSYLIMGMFIPLIVMRLDERRLRRQGAAPAAAGERSGLIARYDAFITELVVFLARMRYLVIPAAAAFTVLTTYLAFQLEPKLDAKEFFDSESDFVVSLDKLDEHTNPALAGEPAYVYITGDLTSPESLAAIEEFVQGLGGNPHVSHTETGDVFLYARTVLDLLRRVMTNDYARQQVTASSGAALTDSNRDGLPDTPEQIAAIYAYITQHGVPLDADTLIYDAIQVGETLSLDAANPGEQATLLVFGVLGTREQARIKEARESLEAELAQLRVAPALSLVGLTGTAFTRSAVLDASTTALNTSLPVTLAACFVILLVWMRSFRFALVTLVPIGLVVSWLYAFMWLVGYNLNFVTATVASVSIGVGVDYAIHMTHRFQEELARQPDTPSALRAAAAGTGVALSGSAASSILGFSVMAFAPMPLFAAYGVLTTMMIFLAAAGSLAVLPSLLMLVAPRRPRKAPSLAPEALREGRLAESPPPV